MARVLNTVASENMLSDLKKKEIQQSLLLANEARHDMLVNLDKLVMLQEDVSHSKISDTIK